MLVLLFDEFTVIGGQAGLRDYLVKLPAIRAENTYASNYKMCLPGQSIDSIAAEPTIQLQQPAARSIMLMSISTQSLLLIITPIDRDSVPQSCERRAG